MREGIIISAVGRDRPGIVDRLSGAIYEMGCNLEDSRMAILGGEFALVALVSGPPDCLAEVRRAAGEIARDLELTAQFKETRIGPAGAEAGGRIPYKLTAVSLDHPGIVHRIANLLARMDVNVADLETRLSHAPVTGAPIFAMELVAQVPAAQPVARLREALKALSDAENIDIDLRAMG